MIFLFRTSRRAFALAALLPLAGNAVADVPAGTPTMTDAPDTAQVEADGLRLTARFAYAPRTGALAVTYRLDNTGDAPVAVFDRGNRHAVLTGRQRDGGVGDPVFEEEAPGRVTLRHAAAGLPRPTPTVPPTPLAAKLDPGAGLEGEFAFAPPTRGEPARMRWCLGVAPFDGAAFTQPQEVDGVEVWQADFERAERQRLLCTPWFDVVAGRFVPDAGGDPSD